MRSVKKFRLCDRFNGPHLCDNRQPTLRPEFLQLSRMAEASEVVQVHGVLGGHVRLQNVHLREQESLDAVRKLFAPYLNETMFFLLYLCILSLLCFMLIS